ncbi:signal transduction histidine kinase [Pseudooceanicola antarcticus]|uniref:histidine kinase n=1 Tax=Pseudooceanicola antarcticus TaxID=1247613 RepID=A0A285HYK8_9RHOB|nr:PAS domain-containing sensor histidine kinase [Pseudooceanicola antarcticus]PJE30357.1 hybrid sensor histidine kinase/response regulator [Pseudooceanicola antarcticus]SNY40802.1 signal transduction histidine kinase [Pseudooceanicola antarcticus]
MSIEDLVDTSEPADAQIARLLRIAEALMRRVEQKVDTSDVAYAQFQRASLLEQEVQKRTRELEDTLDLLNTSNERLAAAYREKEAARANLINAIEAVQGGFALFSQDERLILSNSRFGMHMPDVRAALTPGLNYADYIEIVSRSPHLTLPPGETREDWQRRRMARHKDRNVLLNVRLNWNRWVQVSEHRTPDGGSVILQTDVTDIMRIERQERERMLDDQARLIRATLEHLDQGICIFDRQSRLVGWNRRVGELLAFPLRMFYMGIHAEKLVDWMEGSFTFADGIKAELIRNWTRRQDGRPPLSFEIIREGDFTLGVFAQEMPDRGFVISFTDLTNEREAVRALSFLNEALEARVSERTEELEAALEEAALANETKSRFVAAASHDLLQPLSAAKLFLASAEDEASVEAAPILGKARRALESVEHLMDALVDISRLDSGRTEVHVGNVSLSRLMRQLGDELAPEARAKGLRLRVVPSSAIVASDPTYLRRVLQNLLTNAVRYTREGTVLMGARRRGDEVSVEVIDTGPGIPADRTRDIFREFQRLDSAASASEGMGLGLAIVERACALLDHELSLDSEVGRGTRFAVTLPVLRYDT